MPAPLVGIAVATAARLAAKKLAQKTAKKIVVKATPKRPTKPIDGVFAPLKRKVVNKNIKNSGGNVKIVPTSTPALRKLANDKATLLATRAKSGQAAKTGAKAREQAMKIAKEKAEIADIKAKEKIIAKGGRVIMNPTKKSASKNGVSVIKNPQYRVLKGK